MASRRRGGSEARWAASARSHSATYSRAIALNSATKPAAARRSASAAAAARRDSSRMSGALRGAREELAELGGPAALSAAFALGSR